jgi:molybdopterin-biosynthesis enzyme MoeA-like protein
MAVPDGKLRTATCAFAFPARQSSGLAVAAGSAAFCSPEGYDQVQSFFKDRVKTMPGAERTLAMVLEGIQQLWSEEGCAAGRRH